MKTKTYEIFTIEDKSKISEFIGLDPYKLLNSSDFSSLVVEVDHLEKKAFINAEELYVFIDYDAAIELLKN